MNQGIYGMSNGQGMAGIRKLAGRVGYGDSTPINSLANFRANTLTSTVTGSFTIPQARTRVISVTGRGALRALAVGHVTDNTGTYSVDVVIDGVTVASRSSLSMVSGAGGGYIFFGSFSGYTGSTPYGFCPDYVPFDSSLEVFITTSGAGAGSAFNTPYWVDIHQ